MKISGVYKITNAITGDSYIGSSKNIKERWAAHKKPSTWKNRPNNPLYKDMQKYGLNKFVFEILAEVEAEQLKEAEQKFIEALKPTYNNYNAKGLNIERIKKTKKQYQKEYNKSDKGKESNRKAKNKYNKSDKGKESNRKYQKKYNNQLCSYNGETLTLNALAQRFTKAGIPHSTIEAKKYLLEEQQ